MKSLFIVFLISLSLNVFAQNSIVKNFSSINKNITFYSLENDGYCSQIIGGYSDTNKEYFFCRVDESLNIIWAKSLNFSPYYINARPTAVNFNSIKITVGDDCIYLLCGPLYLNQDYTYPHLSRFNFDGSFAWAHSMNCSLPGMFGYLNQIGGKAICSFSTRSGDSLKVYNFLPLG